jgi:hypothetical protein
MTDEWSTRGDVMGQVVFVDTEAMEWQRPERKGAFKIQEEAPGEPLVFEKLVMDPGECFPRVQLARFEAGHVTKAHSHDTGEILFLLIGALEFGDQVATVGTAVFIEARTVYEFVAGPEGAAFLRVELDRAPTIDR